MMEIKGTLPSGRFNAGFKAGSSSDVNRPLTGAELLVMELADEEDIDERVRVALAGDISKDLGFELNDVNEVVELLRADGGLVTVTIEKGLITRVRFGDGTETDPYQVWNAEDLDDVRNGLDKHYLQMADIDLSGLAWLPIGSPFNHFTGVYDGNSKRIDNISVELSGENDWGGLFSVVSSAIIKNLSLSGVVVMAHGSAGLLAGAASGTTIQDVHVAGDVQTYYLGGGLVGISQHEACTIERCSAKGTITGLDKAAALLGGLVADDETDSNISNCYADVAIGGDCQVVGGLVGIADGMPWASGNYENCHAVGVITATAEQQAGGLVGVANNANYTIVSCYWDTETTGQQTSAGGVGKTTVEMKQAATFVNWDFVNTWQITEGVSYPELRR